MNSALSGLVAPWRWADLATLWSAFAFGAVFVAVGYWGVSGTRDVGEQMGYAGVAAAGPLLVVAGGTRVLLSARRALRLRAGRVLSQVAPAAGVAADTGAVGLPVAAGDMTRYHRSGCAFAAGKPVAAASPADHEAAGRRPCGVCRP